MCFCGCHLLVFFKLHKYEQFNAFEHFPGLPLWANAGELSWVDAPPPPAPLARPASSYYKRKYFLAGHMSFIDFSLFALLDLTHQMGHLTLVTEKKENKNKTRLGQFMSSWIYQFFMDIMFPVQQGASLWERGYSVRLGAVWCTNNHTWGLLHKMQSDIKSWLSPYYLLKVLMCLEPCEPVWTINRYNLGAFHDFMYVFAHIKCSVNKSLLANMW